MKKLFILLIMFSPFGLVAQDYKVSLIPDSLLKDADAVKRFEELHVIIKGINKAVVKHKYAYTILNEAGEDFAHYSNHYDKFHSLSDISGRMFDKEGKLLKSIKKKDISDVSVSDGESMVTDGRTKHFSFYNKSYPYTVEFEDEREYDGIFNLPVWLPIEDDKLSVQKSIFHVETPADYQLRYKQFNYSVKPLVINDNKTISYSWELVNQKAVLFEPYQQDWHEITPTVFIAPTDFEIGGHKGNMSTWDNFGKFLAELYQGRDILPDYVKQDVHRIADGLPTKQEKVKALYNYMQQSTHYVGIQLGIGGWQPFEAKYVAEKKYGDCKALSNYMVSLLKEAGIKANCVTIESGDGRKGLFEDFPCNQFNHIIACVPGEKDTIWLECTSQTVSAGYMGDFTGNRKALLISEDGGHIVKTPNYLASDNLQLRKAEAVIDENGNLIVDVRTHFTGTQQDLQHSLMHEANKDQREKYLNTTLNLPTYAVEKNDYKETKGKIPAIDEYLKITSQNYASVTGKRMFIVPDLFNRTAKLPTERPRQFDIEFRYSYRDVDTIVIKIPSGYTTETMPKDVSVNNKFGSYSMHYLISGNTITLLRINEHRAATFPASDYTELVSFYDVKYKADHAKVVLVKKE
jgi:transglutaminase-like putative cysteine protease